jgi:hypothetical protein
MRYRFLASFFQEKKNSTTPARFEMCWFLGACPQTPWVGFAEAWGRRDAFFIFVIEVEVAIS